MDLGGLVNLVLHGFQVEARALLHRRELDGGLGQIRHLLLDMDEAPELVFEPLEVFNGSGESRSLEGIEPQIHEDRDVWLDGAAEPAVRLIDESILEVVDSRRAECPLCVRWAGTRYGRLVGVYAFWGER
jgi:hypothetical protein